ncbi:TolC family protein [Leptospira sp. 2 VSF19]|uniref:TolC family protein n=1 Tax=Leptospira soteropolitanensis TaxID=2950025 RepID=A0AAW5VKD5_9LEPT|nr:TolC family protein [Leptospira soteropolitanensis]MCW7492103.1 TolC family protein [Leptospira soteropolitanensis]MCW7499685.1 TolC family protein [Leptospira soteropolitanensis]MCW7521936.1 TolC family protein [Leptospira soteropolitanensis]MCW7525790.1 TolC family protein [Leptospira soteropolitanensis]MCW7530096.1 TolC family protein [Leptospira soteropolitanensis]
MQLSQWENGNTVPEFLEQGNSPKKLRLTISQAIEQVIENNTIVQNAKLEIVKADSPEWKNESKYTWKALASIQSSKQLFPENRNNIFAGTIRSQDKISAGIEKQFKTGTYFKSEISTIRYDVNAFENPNAQTAAFGSLLAAPPMYTGALSVTLSQELLKYGFGKNEEDKEKLLKNQTLLVRENYINILTQLVVKILVDYWSLSIVDSQIATYEKVSKNTEEIRRLTLRKTGLGLSEGFEVNQWNQAYLKTQSLLEKAKVDRIEAERNLIRILNVDTKSSIEGVTDLSETLPTGINLKADKEYALSRRTDYLILKREREIAKLALNTALAEDDPSLLATLTYGSLGQNFLSPQENFIARQRGITSLNYPQILAELKMSYPLWDLGIKAGIRDAETNLKLNELKIQNLEQEISQEIDNRYEALISSHALLKDLVKTRKETEIFYNGLMERFRQGRYTAVNVKNALDSLANAELAVTQAKINFNINLVRYELAKNSLFEKYGLDLYSILEAVEKRAKQETDKL